MSKQRSRAYILLVIVALIWGAATPVVKYTLGQIDPLPFLTYRFFISTIIAIVFLTSSKSKLVQLKKNFVEVIFFGILTTSLALGILFVGLDNTTVLDSTLITAVGPLVTAGAGVWLLKEIITRKEKLGMLLTLIGTLVTILGPLITKGESLQLKGNVLIFAYIIIMAYSSVMSKKLVRKGVEPFTLVNFSFIVGFLTIIPFTLYSTSFPQMLSIVHDLSFTYHLGVWYMAFLSGSLAYALWVKAQKSIEVSEAGLFSYLSPLFAAPLAIIWLREEIEPLFVLGGVFVVVGIIIAESKGLASKK